MCKCPTKDADSLPRSSGLRTDSVGVTLAAPADGRAGFTIGIALRNGLPLVICLAPDRDPDLIAAHVRWLLNHPAEARHMGERAALRAQRYTWGLAAARLRRLYADLSARSLVHCS